MIDRLRSISNAIRGLSMPSLVLAIVCLAYAVFVIFASSSHEGDKHLFPAILGFLWALSTYSFIETFRHVPERTGDERGFLKRTRRRLSRFWYWIIGLVFVGLSVAVVAITLRILTIWLREYGAEQS